MPVLDSQGNPVDLPGLDPANLVQGGGQVAVVGPDGWTGTVPAEALPKLLQAGFRPETRSEHHERLLDKKFGDSPVTAGIEGAARTVTGGISDALLAEYGKNYASPEADRVNVAEQVKERNPGAALAGELGGLLVPTGAAGLVGKVGRAAEGAIAGTGLVRGLEAGGTLARAGASALRGGAQAATEGALFGAGQTVSEVSLSADPMNAEAIAAHLGGNMLFGGLTAGAAGAGLSALGSMARAAAVRARNAGNRLADDISASAPGLPIVPPVERPSVSWSGQTEAAARTPMGTPETWSAWSQRFDAGDHAGLRDAVADDMAATYQIKPVSGPVEFRPLKGDQLGQADWNGVVSLQPNLEKELGGALRDLASGTPLKSPAKQEALHAFVHEILHTTGLDPAAYLGGGAVIEEVATDLATRRMMRDLGARIVPRTAEGYDDAIYAVVDAVRKRAGVKFPEAAQMVEDASLAVKRVGAAVATGPSEHIFNFVDALGGGLDDAARSGLADEIGAMRLLDLPTAKVKLPLMAAARDDIAQLDAKGLRAAHKEETARLAAEQEATSAVQRQVIAQRLVGLREEARQLGGGLPAIAAIGGAEGKGFVREINASERQLGAIAKAPESTSRQPQKALAVLEGYETSLRNLANVLPAESAAPLSALADKSTALRNEFMATLKPAGEVASDRLTALSDRLEALKNPSIGDQVTGMLKEKALSGAGAVLGHLLGGPLGAIGGIVAGAGLNALKRRLGSSTFEFATTMGAKLDRAFSAAAGAAPAVARKVALGVSFGARAATDDSRDEMHRKAIDIIGAAANPDAARQQVHDGLAGIRAADPQLALQLEDLAMKRLQYLAGIAPKDPGMGSPSQDRWQPSETELARFSRVVAATEDPMRVLDHLISDTLTPPIVDAVKTVYPAFYQRLSSAALDRMLELKSGTNLTAARKLGLSMLTGSTIDSQLRPEYIFAQQQRYATMRAAAEQQAKGASRPPPPRQGSASDAALTGAQQTSVR